jgi:uncharacterized protein YPO0396
MSLEEMYASDMSYMQKRIALQKQIIANQERLILTKDQIIGILHEQKAILIKTLSDIRTNVELRCDTNVESTESTDVSSVSNASE